MKRLFPHKSGQFVVHGKAEGFMPYETSKPVQALQITMLGRGKSDIVSAGRRLWYNHPFRRSLSHSRFPCSFRTPYCLVMNRANCSRRSHGILGSSIEIAT
jgi:hypothetical protein